jgi:hypothetical protein
MQSRIQAVFALAFFSILTFNLTPAMAQTADSGTSTDSDSDASVILSSSELQQLVGPVALYSDPLLALILPASTFPSEISQAEDYLNNGGSQQAIADQDWDKSVQGLAHYPDVLHMMASNMDWTNQLGAAVMAQQSAVMAAVQTQRAKAKSLGNLVSTPQQQVVTEDGAIQITPANPQTVYVPTYDPVAVYVQPAPTVPLVSFGVGFGLGLWADVGFNWGGGYLCSGGFYDSSFGWSWSYHSWSSSHYAWHRDWRRSGPRPPYRPGHGGHFPGWHPRGDHHGIIHGETWHHDHGGDRPPGIIHGETWHHDHDGGHDHHGDYDREHEHERDRNYERDRERRERDQHRHNTKENHDRHEHREPHHEAHHGGGGHRR